MDESSPNVPTEPSINTVRPQYAASQETAQTPIDPPLGPNIDPTPAHEKPRKECRPDQTPIAKYVLEVLGVSIVAAYTTFAFFQMQTMEDTYTQIANQTIATQAANNISRTTAAVSQRAYIIYPGNPVRIMPSIIRETGGRGWVIFAQLQNGGNTPAFRVITTFNDNFPEYQELGKDFKYPELPNRKMFPNSDETTGPRIVGAHGDASGGAMTVAERDLKRVNTGASHIYLWGAATYNDVFGCSHKTEVCWQIVQFSSLNGNANLALAECHEHNCADKDCKDYTPTINECAGLVNCLTERQCSFD